MDITSPQIDDLLAKTEQNPFLLCTIASKRATDINTMLHGQRVRVAETQGFEGMTSVISGEDPISIAMREIDEGTLSYDRKIFDKELAEGDTNN